MVGLLLLVNRTRIGRAMRHRREPPRRQPDGVDTNAGDRAHLRHPGAALAAVAGVMFASNYGIAHWHGLHAGLKAFTAAVLGGIGNLRRHAWRRRARLVESPARLHRAPYLRLPNSSYQDIFAFIILGLVLTSGPPDCSANACRTGPERGPNL